MEQQPSPREAFQKLRLMLLMGLLTISGMTAVFIVTGNVPFVPDAEWIGLALAVVSAVVAAVGWFWARPQIPLRRPIMSVDEYWRDTKVLAALHLPLFLLEGSAMLAIVGTMMAGIGPVTVMAPVAMLGMVALSPDSIEQRTS